MTQTTEKGALALTLLTPILVEQLGVEDKEIMLTASLIDDLKADSLDLVELVMSLEEKISQEIMRAKRIPLKEAIDMATISDEEAEKIVTVGDAVETIVARLP